jgi:K+-sensing histidine kinase KdpD
MPKILLVDDSRLELELMSDYLRPLEVQIERAMDGYEALLSIEREPPDLVLLDVLIPGPDGIKVLKEIKASQADDFTPVILTTAVTSADYRHAGLEAGADAYLHKPVDPLELLPMVRNFLGVRRRHRELLLQRERARSAQELRQLLQNVLVHDLRNPITVIKSNLHFLLSEMAAQQADPEWQAAASESRAATLRLLRMIGNMLEMSALEETGQKQLHVEDVDVPALLAEVVRRAPIPSGASPVLASAPHSLRLRADRGLLRRALENMLDAATLFAPPGAAVMLGAETQGERVRLHIHAERTTLPEELRRNLFQRFARVALHAAPSVRQAALGLYYCKLVAVAHRGEVGINVDPGGTTFAVALPAEPAPVPPKEG